MSRLPRTLAAALLATASVAAWAADPPEPRPDPGKLTWKDGYPKAVPAKPGEVKGAIELFGEVTVKAGWKVLAKAVYEHAPVTGGVVERVELAVRDGKWGALDPTDKTKVIPAVVPANKGTYKPYPTVTFEGKDANGNTVRLNWVPPGKVIEVK